MANSIDDILDPRIVSDFSGVALDIMQEASERNMSADQMALAWEMGVAAFRIARNDLEDRISCEELVVPSTAQPSRSVC